MGQFLPITFGSQQLNSRGVGGWKGSREIARLVGRAIFPFPGGTVQQLLGWTTVLVKPQYPDHSAVTLHRGLIVLSENNIYIFFIRMNLNLPYSAAFPEANKKRAARIFIWYGIQEIPAALKRRGCIMIDPK